MSDPMYKQIAEDLRLKIESGELGGKDTPLPSELELRDIYSASRNTVRDAVKLLVARGMIVTKPGQGTFVVTKIDPFVTPLSTKLDAVLGGDSAAYLSGVTDKRRVLRASDPRVESQRAKAKGLPVSELRVAAGENVVSRHQERFIDDIPWSLQTSFYPIRLVDQGASLLLRAEDIDKGAVAYIEKTLGIKRAGRRDRYTVRAPDRRETGFFSLPDDGRIAVFEVIQTVYDETGEPFVLTVTTYPADRNEFVMTAGRVPAE
jgi:GntR family transcriptional regulator